MTAGRVCWSCKHFSFDGGHPGYSDVTPGYMGRMECMKKVYRFTLDDITEKVLQESLMKAETCTQFEQR